MPAIRIGKPFVQDRSKSWQLFEFIIHIAKNACLIAGAQIILLKISVTAVKLSRISATVAVSLMKDFYNSQRPFRRCTGQLLLNTPSPFDHNISGLIHDYCSFRW